MADFRQDVLKAHNTYRERHGVPPLTLVEDLNEHAQQWAKHRAANDEFDHSECVVKGERVGENIAMKGGSGNFEYTGQDAVDQWYGEIERYDFKSSSGPGTGHFTQVVWKGSKELGVGTAASRDGGRKVIVVANYRPAGNVIGDFSANVQPPTDGKIIVPTKKECKPTSTTFRSEGGDGFDRFEEMRRGFEEKEMPTSGESRSVRTYIRTEGSGANKVTKKITEETIIKANGEKTVNTTETIT